MRALLGTFLHVESPRAGFRVALRQSRVSSVLEPGRGRRKRPLLIHYHIFKNAGTSFEWALQEAFGVAFRQYDSPDPAGLVAARDLVKLVKADAQLQAISSHQATPPAPRIPGRKVLTSMLIRDPIARIGSIYAFERSQDSDTRGARQAKRLNFKDYVEWRLSATPSLICNYQVNLCCGHPDSGECSQRDLEVAIIRLDAIDIVGTVARYNEWLALARSILQQHYGEIALPMVHHNRSVDRPKISEAEILARLVNDLGSAMTKELLARNDLDMCLYEVADALLTRRLAERAVIVKLRDAYSQPDPDGER